MYKLVKFLALLGLMFIISQYLNTIAVEIFNLNLDDRTYFSWCFNLGILGLSYFIIIALKKFLIKNALVHYKNDPELKEKIVNEETPIFIKITYIIGSFILNISTIIGVFSLFFGYNLINRLNLVEWLGVLTYSVAMTLFFYKYGYEQTSKNIDEF